MGLSKSSSQYLIGFDIAKNTDWRYLSPDDIISFLTIEQQKMLTLHRDIDFYFRNSLDGLRNHILSFDSISKDLLIEVFKIFGFGDNFIRWLEILNNKTMSCINYSGWLSSWFPLERGIRQGCPLSPMCFVLTCELLSNKIRQSNQVKGVKVPTHLGFGEVKLTQFADDATLFLSDEHSLKKSFILIELFSQFSGLVLNKNKTEAIWLGCWKFRKKEICDIKWNTGPNNKVKILGIIFYADRTLDEIEENWQTRISRCESIIKSWSNRNLSLLGKIVLVKTLLASQFVYLMQCMFLPTDVLHKLNSLFFRFVWGKAGVDITDLSRRITERVKREVMTLRYEDGGLNMVDMFSFQKLLCFKWILRLSKNPTGRWSYIPRYFYDKLGMGISVLNSNTKFESFRGISGFFPSFYKQLLQVWLDLKEKNPNRNLNNSAQLLWNNDDFRYRGNTLFIKRWIDHGIFFVSDVMAENGTFDKESVLGHMGDTGLTQFEINIVKNGIMGCNVDNIWQEKDCNVYLNNEPLCSMKPEQFRVSLKSCIRRQALYATKIWIDGSTLSEENWCLARQVTSQTKLLMLQWKILQSIYPTRQVLFRMGLVENNLCLTCNTIDTMSHFFWSCVDVNRLWQTVEREIITIVGRKVDLNEKIVLLGYYDRSIGSTHINNNKWSMINTLILIAKECIHKCKYEQTRNFVIMYEAEKQMRGYN